MVSDDVIPPPRDFSIFSDTPALSTAQLITFRLAFYKILVCLSKFGDRLSIRATNTRLVLSVVDPAHSAYANFGFKLKFFVALRARGLDETRLGEAIQALACQVNLKTLLEIFKISTSAHYKVERCEIKVNDSTGLGFVGGTRLTLDMVYPRAVNQRFRMAYMPEEAEVLEFDRPTRFFSWEMGTSFLLTLMTHFDIRLDEFTIICRPKTIQFLSHHNEHEEALKSAHSRKQLRTDMTFCTEDFTLYNVDREVGFTLRVKEFKAILNLAKDLNVPLFASFTCGGEPLYLGLGYEDMVYADFVLATNESEAFNIHPHLADPYDSFLESQAASQACVPGVASSLSQPPNLLGSVTQNLSSDHFLDGCSFFQPPGSTTPANFSGSSLGAPVKRMRLASRGPSGTWHKIPKTLDANVGGQIGHSSGGCARPEISPSPTESREPSLLPFHKHLISERRAEVNDDLVCAPESREPSLLPFHKQLISEHRDEVDDGLEFVPGTPHFTLRPTANHA
ncbi:Cell cycle checkpoint control protein rad9b [Massospora cicadina]|nr:Cell cycle checkpoint control protein rad9b [Massospora cicadina]